MVGLYIFDTNVFRTLDFYYPARFPTIWNKIEELVEKERLWSVREVRRELDYQCPSDHIKNWLQAHRFIFRIPNEEELLFVAHIFQNQRYCNLVKRSNILKGLPSADPFVIAAGKIHGAIVVTQESMKPNAVSIPNVCEQLAVLCFNLERFLESEGLTF